MTDEYPQRLFLMPDPEHNERWLKACVGDDSREYVLVGTQFLENELSDRMVAHGMLPLKELTAEKDGLGKYMAHNGVRNMDHFEEWLIRKVLEYRRLQAAHQTGTHILSDDMFDFVLGKGGAFSEVLANYNQATEE